MKKKLMALALCTIIAVMAIAGSSLAWLQDTTGTVTNTFTEGKVDIDLYEHDYLPDSNTLDTNSKVMANADYKMVPGKVLPKDPTVVVKASSEACYVFIKVEEINDVDNFLEYSIDTRVWTALAGVDGVYYKKIDGFTANDTEFNVLTGKQVTVNTDVDMDDMAGLTAATRPQLKFTAYAIQQIGSADAAEAWAKFGN
jgi:hypothetical protein